MNVVELRHAIKQGEHQGCGLLCWCFTLRELGVVLVHRIARGEVQQRCRVFACLCRFASGDAGLNAADQRLRIFGELFEQCIPQRHGFLVMSLFAQVPRK
ncbi:hypothetical protein D3C71_1914010 [compost metagenome]